MAMTDRNEALEQLKRAVLLQRLRQTRGAPQRGPTSPPLLPASRERPLPLSFAQQRLWFLDQFDSNTSVAYHMPFALRLQGRLDRAVLQATLDRVLVRHECLRTHFALANGEPVQIVESADVGFSLDGHDLRELPEEAHAAAIARLAGAEARKRFDLSRGPLIRGQLLQLGEQEHILFLTQHHIVSDGWSIGLLVREVSSLYAAFSQNQADPLPALPIQYADYSVWQRQWLQGEVLERQERFWKEQLQGAPQLLELPTDRPRPAVQSFAGAAVPLRLSRQVSAGIRRLAQQQGCTLFMILLAGWTALLSRLCRQDDLVIGTPVANRQRREIESLIGFFVNALALRMRLGENMRIAELIEQVKHTALQAYANQDLPFEHIVEMLQPTRSLSHSPVFQVGISLDNTPSGRLVMPELTLSSMEYPQTTTQFDLYATLTDDGDRIAGSLTYARDLFDAVTIERVAGHYALLLAGMVSDPQQAVHALPLLDDAQRQQVLIEFNVSTAVFALEYTVHQLIEARAAQQPDAVALVYEGTSLSYDQLNRRANQLAHRLLELGVRPDDRVGICAERSFAMVVGLLGILKAGAAYVPLDPTYPADRLAYMLEDSAPAALVSQPSLRHRLSTCSAQLQLLDADGRMSDPDSQSDSENLDGNIDPRRLGLTPRHLAYVIYTSGSTGRPNGVMNEHRGLTNLALAQIEAFGIRQDTRLLQFASFSFDACVSETVITLCRGATLYLASYTDLMPGEPLLKVLRHHRITCVTLPPVALAALPMQAGLDALECLIVAGETCPPELAARWAQGRRFINAYGPTETTVCATTYLHDGEPHAVLPIGRPIANLRIYILDPHRQPVPLGVTGEIFIGGVGVARGYLHREELTSARFVTDPFCADAQARLYKTGDLGRWLPDGNAEYLGRQDTQVKLRGFRIEPGEIESRLREHSQVRDAVVIAREDVPGDRRLVAYLRLESPVELWPSVSEFYVYDELLYHAMAQHQSRNRCYSNAFSRHLAGMTVVEIGPGPHAVLARMAIDAGAHRVYAIELLERSFEAARARIRQLGLEDRIILIHGDATRVELPEPVDYCISEIIGNIAGSEGSAVIINHARRFLKDPARMIPARSLTRIAAVALTEDLFDYGFGATSRHYVEEIFAATGGAFDLRVCVKNLPDSAILSTSDAFEDLDYTQPIAPESDHEISLAVLQDGTLTGFMIWMVLHVDAQNVLDTYLDQGSWLPVYFPVFDRGVSVGTGDRIVATIERRLTQGLYPDFFIDGVIQYADGRTRSFQRALPHRSREYRGSLFYQRLFAAETIPVTTQVSPQILRAHLLETLPEYMLPSAFITLPVFPVTPNGKLDRRALPAPDQQAVVTRGHEAPQGAVELAIAAIWAGLLGVTRIGRRDHFFELGGHSLLAVQMLSRLQDLLGVAVSLRELFAQPTLDALARLATQAHQTYREPIPLADRNRPLPLSFAQQRLWFLAQLDGAASAAYHLPAALYLRGPLNHDALQATLDRLVARHEILRTHFVLAGGEPVQVIAPSDVGFNLTVRDLRHLNDPSRGEAVTRSTEEEAHAAFNLAAGPLIRGRLLQLGEREHILLLTQHHIISDGWSIGVLIREVSNLYAAFSQGHADPLPSLPIQYADYAAWQRQWLQGDVLRTQVDFWKAQLQGAPALLDLPTDRPRPTVQGYAGGAVPVLLPVELSTRLRQLAQQQGCTLFMTLLAGWSTLLSRLSNQDDLVIGTPVANRQRTELESLPGLFVNTLALRVRVGTEASTATLLEQIKTRTLAAYAHQDLPFEQVVDAVQPPRSLGYNPIFQVGLSLDNTPDEDLQLADLALSSLESPRSTTQLDLFLWLSDDGEAIGGELSYASSLFDATTAARIGNYFATLLAAMVADSLQPLQMLPLLSAAQREQLLQGFNQTEVDYPLHHTVQQAFQAQAAAQPDSIALVCEDAQLSYGQLNRRANQIAHRLLALGVRPDQRVAICGGRNAGVVIGLLGILKAGAAYVPLDPSYPLERLNFMLDDSEPVALLTEAGLRGMFPTIDMPVLLLDANAEDPVDTEQSGCNPDPQALGLGSHNLAYVIYTSGSTGKPKGVMIEHGAVVNLLATMAEAPGIVPADALLAVTTLSFDIAALEVFLPLSYGAKLVLAGQGVAADPASLQAALLQHDITMMQATPVTWRMLLAGGWQGAGNFKALCGGEALPKHLSASLRGRVGALWNLYGPTETTIWSARRTIDVLSTSLTAHEPIGRPIANTRIHILDARLQPVPLGVTGEIHIGGAGIARGYWHREELTAERFISDPFNADPRARLYKTGDLGRYLADGTIEYQGRNDFQVKIRGFRIERGEIEARLNECSGVRQAVVAAREDVTGDKRLVAYLLAEEGIELSPAVLREQLSRGLPDYMLPSAFVTLQTFPLTSNGKLDRQALRAPEADAYRKRAHEAPTGEIEIAIAGIWQDLLHVEHVGRHDHFFELGGHSLLAVQLVSRLRQVLGADVALRDLFATPTLAVFAKRVAEATALVLPPIQPADRTQNLPLSWAQQRLWFLAQLDPAASAAYHMSAALQLQGSLDSTALTATLDRIVARHAILRTRFVKTAGGEPIQVIASADIGFSLSRHDLRNLAKTEQQAAIVRLSEDEFQRPFDLSSGLLIRGQLLQLDDDDHILLFCQHHIISDGWSIGILVREITALYAAFTQELPDPLPPLSIQYADYALWQRQWLQGEALQTQIDFWRNHLAGAPVLLELPTDHPRPATQSYAGASIPLMLPADLTTALRALSQRHGTTLFMTLLAGWSILLARLSGQNDLVIGTTVANRQRLETESLIGFFANTLALRVELGDVSVAELLRHVKALTLDAYAHQDVSFEQVVEALQPVRSLSHSPLFQVLFSLDNIPAADTPSLRGLQLAPIAAPRTTTQFDLLLSLTDSGEAVRGDLSYCSALFERPAIERIIGHFQTLLSAMVAEESQPIRALPLLTAAQRQQLLVEWNASQAPCSDRLIHQLFEIQAASQPRATALVYQDQSLTYGELNAKANRLSHYLLSLGIRPDDRVALCVERSLEMVVGLLGILKAGGAYVPLDPGSPEAHLAFMLTDCAPVALLTQATLAERLPAMSMLRVVVLDDASTQAVIGRHQSDNVGPVAVGLTPSHLAYVIYTSGSTGKPKGVMVEHGGLTHYLQWAQRHYLSTTQADSRADSIVSSPLAFDATITSLYAPLISGGAVTLIAEGEELAGLTSLLRQPRSWALMKITPAHLAVLAKTLHADGLSCEVQCVVVGGEALPSATVALWQAVCPTGRLINEYGPTETVVGCSIYDASESSAARDDIPIGRPIANMTMYLLDTRRQPVPIGVTGEIYIGGVQVARGYLNRPDLTQERFLPDPFSAAPDARMYKTGDLGRYLPDANLVFLGRNDFQVKVRGFRIELGEIEAQLLACRGVREAVVIAREDTPGEKRLVAYLVPEEGAELSVAELRAQLASALTEYMVPAAYVTLPSLPLTPNGKLDRRVLPAPEADSYRGRAYEAPIGEIELSIAGIWQDLLHVEHVGRHDQFFELGGHSLLAVQLVSRLRQVLGADVALRDLFATPTLAGFAKRVAQATALVLPPIRPADRMQQLSLSWAQQRLWFLAQLDPAASAAYHMPAALQLQGSLDSSALKATLDRIVARHEILRTSFVETAGGEPIQVIASADIGFALSRNDLRNLAESEQQAAIVRLSEDEFQRPFDLSSGPLIRGQLLQLDDDHHILLFCQHHIICDGWSIGVLFREITALYAAFKHGLPDPLSPLSIQYADYAMWQRQWLQGDLLKEQVEFWKQCLQGAPTLLALPTTGPRPVVQSYTGSAKPVSLPIALSSGLRELCQQHGCTLFMTLYAGLATLLSRLSGQNDVVIGTPVANRQRTEVESLLGFFANTLALRVQVEEGASVASLLKRVKHGMLAAYGHQELPFEQVVEALQPQRSLSHSPIFQVMLNINNTPGGELTLPGLELGTLTRAQTTTRFDLALSLIDNGETIVGELTYASELFDANTVERMLEQLQVLLAGMVADAAQTIGELCAFLPASPASRTDVLQAGLPRDHAAAERPYEMPRSLSELAIAAVWSELLECGQVGRHDDFFALGGVSLMAVRMLSRLRKSLGRQVSLRELFTHPTLAEFAHLFEVDRQPLHAANLVAVRPGGGQPPLHLVHPVGGEIQYVHDLANWLDTGIPVYGLAATGFAPGETPARTVPQLAARYVDAIRQVQPEGPYRLAGWSAGGMIAYEMGRQLSEQGQAVGFVGLIDTTSDYWRHRPTGVDDAKHWTEANYVLSWLPESLPVKQRQQFEQLAAADDVDAMLELSVKHGLLPPGLPPDIEADALRGYLSVSYATQEALLNYVPISIDVPVSLFAATEEVRADLSLAWRQVLGKRLVVIPIPGTHMSMVKLPHIRYLSQALSGALAGVAVQSSNGRRRNNA